MGTSQRPRAAASGLATPESGAGLEPGASAPSLLPDALPQEPVVLLVEDDAGDALLVEELVADVRPTMALRWVRSLTEAHAFLEDARPDCILLDLHLPDGQGIQALRAVQGWAEGVAVVVLTGLAEAGTGLAAVAAGAQDYLVKGSVDGEWLGRAVRYAVQRKQAEQAAAALQASQLHAQENARLERGLLPRPLLGEGTGLEVVTRYHPGRAQALLGGDFYDVVETDDGTAHLLIGDVSGHGPDEAALGVALRIAWRTLVLSGIDGVERVRRLEQILVAERAKETVFATLTSVSLPAAGRAAHVVRAGHPGMFVRHGDGIDLVELPAGPALGLLPKPRWHVETLDLPEQEWAMVLFTDGLFEGRVDDRARRLEEDGLLDLARTLGARHGTDFVDALIGGAQALSEPYGGLADDVAVVHVGPKDPR